MKKLLLTLFLTSSIFAYANNENFDNYFIDGNGDDIKNWGLDPNSYIVPDPYFPYEHFENKELENSSWKNSHLTHISFENSNLTNADFENAHIGYGTNFSNADLTNVNFKNVIFWSVGLSKNMDGANFEDAYFLGGGFGKYFTFEHFKQTKNYKEKDIYNINFVYMNLKNWDFTGFTAAGVFYYCDLRGAINSNALLANTGATNTIDQDGFIKGFQMDHDYREFSIAKYDGINAKLDKASSISDGAVLTLESGAILDIVNNSVLTLANEGTIIFDISDNLSTSINIEKESGFVLQDGGTLIVNLTDEFVLNDKEINVMSWDDGTTITGFYKLVKGEDLILKQNGLEFNNDFWSFEVRSDGLYISVPEPSTYAAVIGAIALAFAVYRRRK